MGASPPPSCSAFRGAPRGCPGACGGFPRRLPHERAPLARQCRACGEAPPTPRRRSPVRPFPAGLCPPGARGILRAHAPACFSSRRTGLPPAPVSPKPSGADAGPAGRPAVGACPGPGAPSASPRPALRSCHASPGPSCGPERPAFQGNQEAGISQGGLLRIWISAMPNPERGRGGLGFPVGRRAGGGLLPGAGVRGSLSLSDGPLTGTQTSQSPEGIVGRSAADGGWGAGL